jgi:hypothetical protein
MSRDVTLRDRLREWLIRVLWLYRATGPLPGRAAVPARAPAAVEGRVREITERSK